MPFKKYDAHGQPLTVGDVVARSNRGRVELLVYKGESWGGKNSKGEFGRFLGDDGQITVKYNNVIFVFDPMSQRRAKSNQINILIREFYEGKK